MSNTWGTNLKLSLFGESHGPAVGIVIDGLPPGFPLELDTMRHEMARRAPGQNALSTPRKETDDFEILSGFFEGRTTGSPLCAIIRSTNTRSGDYTPQWPRPGHADLTAYAKYKGFADYRGGGHFSGRLTAPLVFAGAAAKQILAREGIAIGARILSIHTIQDAPAAPEDILAASQKPFPVHDDAMGEAMQRAILTAKSEGDSVGGVIECAALGVPLGWGEPFFGSLESTVASMMFSIPAVKAVSFGSPAAQSKGSAYNDPYAMENGQIAILSNHSGGVLGGITNGNPVVFTVAIKPTPTIAQTQTTVDLMKHETVQTQFGGRHDPCIAPRAAPVVEAGLALCLLDLKLTAQTQGGSYL